MNPDLSPSLRRRRSEFGPREDRGPVLRVALVGCGKAKAKTPKPARELYTGGLFRAGLAHALATADVVRIVSAMHGLVDLDDEIAPYEMSLAHFATTQAKRDWGKGVVEEIVRAFPDREIEITMWMGGDYTDYILPTLNQERIAWSRPLDGLSQGLRLSWFAKEAQRRKDRAELAELEAQAQAALRAAALVAAEPRQLALPAPWAGPRQLALFG